MCNCECKCNQIEDLYAVKKAIDKAYHDGVKKGFNKCVDEISGKFDDIATDIYNDGFSDGQNDVIKQMEQCLTVKAVYFQNDRTAIKFADDTVEFVDYHPEYGYPYDKEKAIMAAMLKRVYGSYYIHILKANVDYTPKSKFETVADEYAFPDEVSDVFVAYDGNRINLTEDEKLLQDIRNMSDDITF